MKYCVVIVLCAYILLVRCLRYRRRDQGAAKLNPELLQHAHKLAYNVGLLEFPFMYQKSMEFALARTYGIAKIAKLLCKTQELIANVSQRYDATDILLRTMAENYCDDPKAITALQRINYIHSRYNIPNDQYLYTLSVFIFEPIRWINKHEWRQLTSGEKESLFVYWRNIGIKMNIKDIPATYEEFENYNILYEQQNMVFSNENHQLAVATLNLFTSIFPKFLKSFIEKCLYALIDVPLLKALGLPQQSPFLQKTLDILLHVRKYFIRYLMLPRNKPQPRTGPLHKNQQLAREKLGSILEDDVFTLNYDVYGENYPDGYQLRNIGPSCFFNNGKLGPLGKEESLTTKGCPFLSS